MPPKEKMNSSFVPLVCNALLVVGKGITGILANSNALVSDAIHSMTDVAGFYINYRACGECQLYSRIDSKRSSKRITQKAAQAGVRATYQTGILLFSIGLAICFHNSMILLLDRAERPAPISAVVAFAVVVVYAGVYAYSRKTNGKGPKECVVADRNTAWQNRMNLVSGVVVLIGLAASLFGCVSMDEFAAVVVGSILVAMGVSYILQAREGLSPVAQQHFRATVCLAALTSVILAGISLSFQL